jgi:hypothetical protein
VNIRLGQAWEKYGVIDWLVGKSLGAGGMDGSVGHGMALCGAGAVGAVGGFMVAFVLISRNCIRVFVVLDSYSFVNVFEAAEAEYLLCFSYVSSYLMCSSPIQKLVGQSAHLEPLEAEDLGTDGLPCV